MFANTDPRQPLYEALTAYTPAFNSYEQVNKMVMLNHLVTHENCLVRDCFTLGHFTGSAWVVNPNHSKVLLIMHPKFNKWMQPGGHADGEGALDQVALRELCEEVGVAPHQAKQVGGVYDLDIHPIPEALKHGRTEPAHVHMDVRFMFEVDDNISLVSPEGITLQWFTHAEARAVFTPDEGRWRMLEKTVELSKTNN